MYSLCCRHAEDPATAHWIRDKLFATKTIFYISYSVNFILYSLAGANYRNAVAAMCRPCCPSGRFQPAASRRTTPGAARRLSGSTLGPSSSGSAACAAIAVEPRQVAVSAVWRWTKSAGMPLPSGHMVSCGHPLTMIDWVDVTAKAATLDWTTHEDCAVLVNHRPAHCTVGFVWYRCWLTRKSSAVHAVRKIQRIVYRLQFAAIGQSVDRFFQPTCLFDSYSFHTRPLHAVLPFVLLHSIKLSAQLKWNWNKTVLKLFLFQPKQPLNVLDVLADHEPVSAVYAKLLSMMLSIKL